MVGRIVQMGVNRNECIDEFGWKARRKETNGKTKE
jgi:hypothetical protein